MKLIYDALIRTIIALIMFEVVSIPFMKLDNSSMSSRIFDVLIFAVPVFTAMLSYDIVNARIGNRVAKKSK